MCVEIEAKLMVGSLDKVMEKLCNLEAEFVEEQMQTDAYFDDAEKTFIKTDKCLRLRRQVTGEGERVFLTYKGAKEENEFKRRREVEVEIGDGRLAETILAALKYEKVLVFEKKRRLWRFGECRVALDELPLLGSFVEIEGPDGAEIADAQRKLGMADLMHISESYASLMEARLQELGKREREVFFVRD